MKERLASLIQRAPVRGILQDPGIQRRADRFLLQLASGVNPKTAKDEFKDAFDKNVFRRIDAAPSQALIGKAAFWALEEAVLRRVLHYGWTVDDYEDLLTRLKKDITDCIAEYKQKLSIPEGPFILCRDCRHPCTVFYEAVSAADDRGYAILLSEAFEESTEDLIAEALKTAVSDCIRRLYHVDPDQVPTLKYCLLRESFSQNDLSRQWSGKFLPLVYS